MAHRLAPAKGCVDLEALLPRDANAQRVPKATETKAKPAGQLRSAKDKEHPPPPPPQVFEPSSSDRPDGALYQVGKLLGKGGFAICYSGQHAATRQKYALKIVKCRMPLKMEQKVGLSASQLFLDHAQGRRECLADLERSFSFSFSFSARNLVPNRAANSFENEAQEYCAISQSIYIQ